jgi:hypothetical protein
MSPRTESGIGAALGAAAGFLGGSATYAHRSRKVQTNAAIWGTFLGGILGAVIGAPSEEGLKNRCAAGTLADAPLRFP